MHRAAVFQLIATNEDSELFEEMFQEGKDRSSIINRPNSSGETFLYAAAEKQSLEKVKRLINARPHGADINLANSSKQTPLHIACDKKSTEITLELLNEGAKVLLDRDGAGPDMTWLGLDSWRYGIKHVVEEPNMLELLQAWTTADEDSQEEAEMKVSDKFKGDIKVLTITLPAAMESQKKENVQEVVRRWNNNHATKCE